MLLKNKLSFWVALNSYVEAIVSGVPPLSLPKAKAKPIKNLIAFGGCTQSGTPTPAVPVDIVCNNGTVKARYSNGLPLTYQPLEYVGFQGSSYSLGVAGFDDATSEIYIEWKTDTSSTSSNYQSVFVVWSANTYNSWRMLTYYTDTDKFYVYANSRNPSTALNVAVDAWHELQVKSGVFKIDSDTYNPTVTTSLTPSDITFKIGGSQLNCYYKYIKLKRQGEWINIFLPAKRLSDNKIGLYDIVNNVFKTSTSFSAGPNASIPVEVYVEGTQETIVIKDDQSATVSSAVAEMLLKVDDYQDVQSIIDGVVTRNIGVKVLDGTEDWVSNTSDIYTFGLNGALKPPVSPQRFAIPCTHFVGTDAANASMPDNSIKQGTFVAFPDDGGIGVKMTSAGSVAGFKQWLADQYAAGTPVIIAYVLKNSTTEHVAGQTMATAEGDNTAEISQASMSGLELSVKYIKRV